MRHGDERGPNHGTTPQGLGNQIPLGYSGYGFGSSVGTVFAALMGTFQLAPAPAAPAPPNTQPYTPAEMAGLDPQDLRAEINDVNAEIANNYQAANAFATLAASVASVKKTAVTFNLGIVQFDSILAAGLRDALGQAVGLIDVTANQFVQLSANYASRAQSQEIYLQQLRGAHRAQARQRALDRLKLPALPGAK